VPLRVISRARNYQVDGEGGRTPPIVYQQIRMTNGIGGAEPMVRSTFSEFVMDVPCDGQLAVLLFALSQFRGPAARGRFCLDHTRYDALSGPWECDNGAADLKPGPVY
jgi:hypothetical protein